MLQNIVVKSKVVVLSYEFNNFVIVVIFEHLMVSKIKISEKYIALMLYKYFKH